MFAQYIHTYSVARSGYKMADSKQCMSTAIQHNNKHDRLPELIPLVDIDTVVLIILHFE